MWYNFLTMNDKRPLIVTGLVLLLIIVLIGGVIFYLVNFFRSRQDNQQATQDIFPHSSMNVVVVGPDGSPSPTPLASPVTGQANQNTVTGVNGNSKFINASGVGLSFPTNWGVLTCSNSKNFELDPYNNSDVTVSCAKATKPITILVNKSSCADGQVITLGNTQVRKTVDTNFITREGRGSQYHWCTQTTPSLDITHRVGTGTAFSQDDFSTAVEQMISTFTPAAGS